MDCDCDQLPTAIGLEHDIPRLAFEQRFATSVLDPEEGVVRAQCKDCGQRWRVDQYDPWPVHGAMAIKVLDFATFMPDDDRRARLDYLRRSYDGEETYKCVWAGCQHRAMKGVAMCAEHLYDRMGVRVRLPDPPPDAAERARRAAEQRARHLADIARRDGMFGALPKSVAPAALYLLITSSAAVATPWLGGKEPVLAIWLVGCFVLSAALVRLAMRSTSVLPTPEPTPTRLAGRVCVALATAAATGAIAIVLMATIWERLGLGH